MKEILGGHKMKEPTRQQIKEAFKETVERCEKIVEDPEYYHKSECKLCGLYDEDQACHRYCPIRLYGDYEVCRNTPHDAFLSGADNASEVALAELNFLRKVYIWWMEKEKPTGVVRKEKKEWSAWIDITENIEPKIHVHSDGTGVVRLYDGEHRFGYLEAKANLCSEDKEKYRVQTDGFYFRILKKT